MYVSETAENNQGKEINSLYTVHKESKICFWFKKKHIRCEDALLKEKKFCPIQGLSKGCFKTKKNRKIKNNESKVGKKERKSQVVW